MDENQVRRRRVASIALFIILIAATLAIVLYATDNGSNPIGPPTPSPGGAPTATPQPDRAFGITISNPTNAEDRTIWQTENAITISSESCVLLGSSTPSVTITLRYDTDRSATGTELNTGGNTITSTTTGNDDTSFNNPNVAADSWMWIETTAQSGTVDEISCTWRDSIN